MKLFRAFVAGLVFPSIVLPIALCISDAYGNKQLLQLPQIHVVPLIWGIWNALYFAICRHLIPGGLTVRYLLTGGILGVILAFLGVFWLDLPGVIGLPEEYHYYPLFIVPIAYAIVWLVVVYPLNRMLNVEE